MTLVVNEIGLNLDFKPPVRFGVAALLALVMVQVLARGMTRPLRDMEKAAAAMAAGELDRRVMTSSVDEVGRLAAAFNHMAAELAELDRERRDLVANVSHELRTPISSLRAMLENLVDGVTPADPAVLASMLAQVERLQRLVSQLLDLARLESGRSPLHLGSVPVLAVLTDVAEEVARWVPARRCGSWSRRPTSRLVADRAPPPGRGEPRRERGALLTPRRRSTSRRRASATRAWSWS